MSSAETHEQLLPFPTVPEAVKNKHSISDLALRRFGIYESDLNVDFSAPRPFLVTSILDCCTRDARGHAVDRNFFWDLTVGTRTECLLRLIATGDQAEIPLSLRCPKRGCGHELEIELTFDEISELHANDDEPIVVTTESSHLKLRRPTGNDQLAWLGKNFELESEAIDQMVSTLIVDGPKQDLPVAEIARVMEEHDPLVNFTVRVECPDCEHEFGCEVDLQELSLSRLRQAQFRLLTTVHRLAAHYHWSEEEIFKVPYWRRDHYLSLLGREKQL